MGDNTAIVHAMLDSRCLFYFEMLGSYSQFRTMEDDFGIIPPPKYDEAQENYHAYVSNGWTSTYVVPITNPISIEPETSLKQCAHFQRIR